MNINFSTPINFRSLGFIGLNICKELTNLNHRVSLFPIPCQQMMEAEPQNHQLIKELIENAKEYNNLAPSLRNWHIDDLAQHVGRGKHIGWVCFELDNFTHPQLNHLLNQDKLLTCSTWAKRVLRDHIKDLPIEVVPLGVDANIFSPTYQSTGTSTKFVNLGKLENRKGHAEIRDIFNSAFTKNDNVELHMAWSNPFVDEKENKEWVDYYKNSPLGNKIFFHPWFQSQKEVADLINSCDCGLFPSKAEGWNFELLESMACGKHVIATYYSGHTEYCTNYNAHLIDIDEKEDAFDGKWFFGQGQWAKFGDGQIEQAVAHMRHIHHKKQNGSLGVNEEGLKTAGKFTWKNSAEKLVEAISD